VSVDNGLCYRGNCLSQAASCAARNCVTCPYAEQDSLNSGQFCAKLYCATAASPTVCFPFVNTFTGVYLPLDDGIPCGQQADDGTVLEPLQCFAGTCQESSILAANQWNITDWSICDGSCKGPQTRFATCLTQHGQPTVPEACTPPTPLMSQVCEGCFPAMSVLLKVLFCVVTASVAAVAIALLWWFRRCRAKHRQSQRARNTSQTRLTAKDHSTSTMPQGSVPAPVPQPQAVIAVLSEEELRKHHPSYDLRLQDTSSTLMDAQVRAERSAALSRP